MENPLVKKEHTLGEIERIDYFRKSIIEFEEQLASIPGSYGDAKRPGQDAIMNKKNPLKHTIAGGLYIREIFMPKGQLMTTGIHKKEHPFFVLKGDVSVLTENGTNRIKAPYNNVTKPGTKRIIYMHEDTVWITVHATEKESIPEILEDIIAKDFDDPDISIDVIREKLKLENSSNLKITKQ